MSDQINSFVSPVDREVVEQIELLELSTIQKLHLKLMSHCLVIFKELSKSNDNKFPSERLLKEWCKAEAEKLDDKSFSPLLFEQMIAAGEKLNNYAISNKKDPLDLNLDDLISLTTNEKLN